MAAAQVKKLRTKVVVRNLPPSMQEAVLLTTLGELEQGRFKDKYSWFSFVQGKVRYEYQETCQCCCFQVQADVPCYIYAERVVVARR